MVNLDLPLVLTPGTEELPEGPGRVCFRQVTFHHDPGPPAALSDLDLVLEPGSTTAVVGATGSGKTTLSQLIPRLLDPTSGSVTINGMDLRRATLPSITAHLGMVAQDTFLLHTTVADNLRLVRPEATDDDLARAATAAQIHGLSTNTT